MRAVTVKRLRRAVFGDMNLKNVRRYVRQANGVVRLSPDDPRAPYQAMKRDHYDTSDT